LNKPRRRIQPPEFPHEPVGLIIFWTLRIKNPPPPFGLFYVTNETDWPPLGEVPLRLIPEGNWLCITLRPWIIYLLNSDSGRN
jgi:hypothetical protein